MIGAALPRAVTQESAAEYEAEITTLPLPVWGEGNLVEEKATNILGLPLWLILLIAIGILFLWKK